MVMLICIFVYVFEQFSSKHTQFVKKWQQNEIQQSKLPIPTIINNKLQKQVLMIVQKSNLDQLGRMINLMTFVETTVFLYFQLIKIFQRIYQVFYILSKIKLMFEYIKNEPKSFLNNPTSLNSQIQTFKKRYQICNNIDHLQLILEELQNLNLKIEKDYQSFVFHLKSKVLINPQEKQECLQE
ncbi:unnamed protein product [Paramecium pentaurelia]|uniref:Transmembrane protein n=1 Tax=Paramecium pentaurelia TaxID=43138 RepID=A0A8S1USD8_9CILI|nr:unnamed protein product [Paramecium pentaurelia]